MNAIQSMPGRAIFFLLGLVLLSGVSFAWTDIGGGICTCNSCSDCTDALDDTVNCTSEVQLIAELTGAGATCINDPANFNSKTLDCQGHYIDGTDTDATYGIYLRGQTNNTISNCQVGHFRNGAYVFDSSSYNTFINNTFYSSISDGVSVQWSYNNTFSGNTVYSNVMGFRIYGSLANNFTNNSAHDNSYSGIYLQSSSENILLNNTAFDNYAYDVYLSSGGSEDRGEVDCDNVFENTTSSGGRAILYSNSSTSWGTQEASEAIFCNADGATADNLALHGSDSMSNNGVLMLYSDNTEISNTAVSHSNHGFYLVNCSENTFTNITADGSTGYGFFIFNGGNTTLINATVYNHAEDGVHASDGIIVRSSNIHNNDGSGIYVPSDTTGAIEVSNSNISGNLEYGFVAFSPNGLRINNNTFDGQGSTAIYTDGATNTNITNNIISNTHSSGISVINLLGDGVFNVRIQNNRVYNSSFGASSAGMRVLAYTDTAQEIYVYNNTVANGRNGMVLDADYAYIYNNTVVNSTQYGFDLEGGNNIIVNNTEERASLMGFSLQLAASSFENNTASGSMYGIMDMGSVNTAFTRNTAHSNSVGGLIAYGTSYSNFTYNRAYGNALGFFGYGVTFSIVENNNFSGNSGFGMYLNQTAFNEVNHNTVDNNAQGGINIENSGYTGLINNTASGSSAGHGIRLNSSGFINITNSTCNNNAYSGLYMFNTSYVIVDPSYFCNNLDGIYLNASLDITVDGSVACNNAEYGIANVLSNGTTIANSSLYNNTYDFYAEGESEFVAYTLLFLNQEGALEDYTNLSLGGALSSGESYTIDWATNSSALPANHISFEGKWADISNQTGAPSIDWIFWHWEESELGGAYDESTFSLWEYNSSGEWTNLNATLNTSAHTLNLTGLSPASLYGILAEGSEEPNGTHSHDDGNKNMRECNSDSDCSSCEYCSIANKKCLLKETSQCMNDSGCSALGAGYKCGGCSCILPECTTNSDCAAGRTCVDYECILPECTDDSYCQSGYECKNYRCIEKEPELPSEEGEPQEGGTPTEVTPTEEEPLEPVSPIISVDVPTVENPQQETAGTGISSEQQVLCGAGLIILLVILAAAYLLKKKAEHKKGKKGES